MTGSAARGPGRPARAERTRGAQSYKNRMPALLALLPLRRPSQDARPQGILPAMSTMPLPLRSDGDEHSSQRRALLLVLGAASWFPLEQPRKAAAAPAAAATTTEADVAYAIADIVACREYTRRVLNLVRAQAFADAKPILARPPISSFSAAVAVVTQGPSALDAEQRAGILASPFAASIAELADAIAAEDLPRARSAAKVAAKALDQVLEVCASAGLLP